MMETALSESLRALHQDQTHVVLVVAPELVDELVAQLTRELVDTTRVGIARFTGNDESSAAQCVLSALGVLSKKEAPLRARNELEQLALDGSTLTLLIPDALSIDAKVLRDLGELAMESGNVLRLALITERDPTQSEDPAARIVAGLGTGAAKIDVAPPRRPPQEIPAAIALPTPDINPKSRPKTQRAIPVRAERPLWLRPKRRRGLVAGSLLATLALWIWSFPPEAVSDRLAPLGKLAPLSSLAAVPELSRAASAAFPDAFPAANPGTIPGAIPAAIPAAIPTAMAPPAAAQVPTPPSEPVLLADEDADEVDASESAGSAPTLALEQAPASNLADISDTLSTPFGGIELEDDPNSSYPDDVAFMRPADEPASLPAVSMRPWSMAPAQLAGPGTATKTAITKAMTAAALPQMPRTLDRTTQLASAGRARPAIEPTASRVSKPRAKSAGSLPKRAAKKEPKLKTKRTVRKSVAQQSEKSVPVNLNAHPYADVEIDGEAVGHTPIANLPLSPGWHRVRAVYPDGRVSEERVRVDSLQHHFRIP